MRMSMTHILEWKSIKTYFDLGAIDFHESRDLDGQAKLR